MHPFSHQLVGHIARGVNLHLARRKLVGTESDPVANLQLIGELPEPGDSDLYTKIVAMLTVEWSLDFIARPLYPLLNAVQPSRIYTIL